MSQAKGYGQFCPVAKTAEIFAQRWTPLIARELCYGPRRFSEIQTALPLMSRSLLARRLQELEAFGVIETRPCGAGHVYAFTAAGEALRPIVEQMSAWGQSWGQGYLGPDDFDPAGLLWGMKRHIDPARIPPERLVVRFDFRGLPRRLAKLRYWWLVADGGDVDVCQKDPLKPVDVVIDADLAVFTRVWLGHEGLADAVARRKVAIGGPATRVNELRHMLALPENAASKSFSFAPRAPGASESVPALG